MGGECDEDLFVHISNHIRVLAADGSAAERRGLFEIIRTICPRVLLLVRDMAHAARIAAKGPLHNDEIFGHVWEELFNKQHALVPDFQHSDKLKALLQMAQQEVLPLRVPARDRPIDTVLRHFSFAKQRFDSFAVPAAKVAIMLLPIATVLAIVASDHRVEMAKRTRSKGLLKHLTPKFCTALGLSADFGLLVADFIRVWDMGSHDIARST